MMQTGKLGLGSFVVRRIRSRRQRGRTEHERHEQAGKEEEETPEHAEKIPEVLLIVVYRLPPVNGKKSQPHFIPIKIEKIFVCSDFFVDTSPVLLYKRFRSTTRE
jgi:hypothetical protein